MNNFVDVDVIKAIFEDALEKNSGFETHRKYLGMSQISECPRRLFHQYVYGMKATPEQHVKAVLGYMFERTVKEILLRANFLKALPKAAHELIAGFDNRFRGHIDGVTIHNELADIKSLPRIGFDKQLQSQNVSNRIFMQMQAYMGYARFRSAIVIFVCRETMRCHPVRLHYAHRVFLNLEEKAKRVLQAIDSMEEPECMCGWCENGEKNVTA